MGDALDAVVFDAFFCQAHGGLEEVIEGEFVGGLVAPVGLGDGIQTVAADISVHLAEVVLLDGAVILLLEGTTAADFQGVSPFFPEAQWMMVEEFAPVVGVDFR